MLKQKLYILILNCVLCGKLIKVIEMFSDELRFTQLLRQLKPESLPLEAAEIPNPQGPVCPSCGLANGPEIV